MRTFIPYNTIGGENYLTMFIQIALGIVIGGRTLAWIFGRKDDYSEYDDKRSSDDIRKDILDERLKKGLNPEEIVEDKSQGWFKSKEEVEKYIQKFNLVEKFEELAAKRKINPNLPIDLKIQEYKKNLAQAELDVKQYSEDYDLAVKTHNFEKAQMYRDFVKNNKNNVKRYEAEIKLLSSSKVST